jgi:putative Holliday junction resolvase
MMSDTPDSSLEGIVLGFDFGTKKIGVAVGQTVTKTANPLGLLRADQGVPRWESIQKLISEWQPVALVVGIPLKMDGSPQRVTQQAQQFADALKQRFHLPVFGIDERLTTVEARDRVFQEQGYKGLQKTAMDAVAAKIILEAWLRSLS